MLGSSLTSMRRDRGRRRAALGFARATADWRALVADPRRRCRRHLHAEPPAPRHGARRARRRQARLLREAAGARRREAAELARPRAARGVCNAIGFNYICNPILRLAREMIAAGELGEMLGFAAAISRTTWRTRRAVQLALRAALAGAGRARRPGIAPDQPWGTSCSVPIARVRRICCKRCMRNASSRGSGSAVGRERGHRASAGRVRFGRARHDGDQPGRDGLQMRARISSARHARQPRVRPGAHERAASL